MARKDKLDLVPVAEPAPKTAEPSQNAKGKKVVNKKGTGKRKFNIGKIFREMISELKKVKWASFKTTANNVGVLKQTGTVLIVVIFFLVIISLFDLGLTELLKLLLSSAVE